MNIKYYLSNASQALVTTSLIIALLGMMFFVVEPRVGRAVDSGPFTIKQTITDEISFTTHAANVTMYGQLQGITGGTANGSTTVVVKTNNATGYEMTIAFASNSTLQTMKGDVTGDSGIRDYPAASGQPTYLFSTASTAAVFAYTVDAEDELDIDPSFIDNGAACNQTGSYTFGNCWMEPATTTFMIIDRAGSASSGATSSVHFRVHVPNNPNPVLQEDVYTATATLTAVNT